MAAAAAVVAAAVVAATVSATLGIRLVRMHDAFLGVQQQRLQGQPPKTRLVCPQCGSVGGCDGGCGCCVSGGHGSLGYRRGMSLPRLLLLPLMVLLFTSRLLLLLLLA